MATMAAPTPRVRTGGSVTTERSRASSPRISRPPNPAGMRSSVSKRQNRWSGASTSLNGSFAFLRATLSPSRSQVASGKAVKWVVIQGSARLAFARCRAGRAAAHVDAGAVAAGSFAVDIAQQQQASVELQHLAIACIGRRSFRAEIDLAVCSHFEAQLLRLARVGEMHHDAAGRPAPDRISVVALAAGRDLGARPVGILVIGRIAPAAD